MNDRFGRRGWSGCSRVHTLRQSLTQPPAELHLRFDVVCAAGWPCINPPSPFLVIDIYLWVLEQNVAAQRFYGALGGEFVERVAREPQPGHKLRVYWPDPRRLIR